MAISNHLSHIYVQEYYEVNINRWTNPFFMSHLGWPQLINEGSNEGNTHPFYSHSSSITISIIFVSTTCHNQAKIPLFAALNVDVIGKQPKWRAIAWDHIVGDNTVYNEGHRVDISQFLSLEVITFIITSSKSVNYKNKNVQSKKLQSTRDVAHSRNVRFRFTHTTV